MSSQKDTETIIKGLMQRTFKLKGDHILAVAVIYPSIRKSPPSTKLIAELIKKRHDITPAFSSSPGTIFEIRKMNPEKDIGIERNPGNFLAPILARQLADIDLSGCEAIAYRDFDDNLGAWEGALYIGIVTQA